MDEHNPTWALCLVGISRLAGMWLGAGTIRFLRSALERRSRNGHRDDTNRFLAAPRPFVSASPVGFVGPHPVISKVGEWETVIPVSGALFVIGPSKSVIVGPEKSVVTVGPSRAVQRVMAAPALVVEPTARAVWDDRGWTQQRVNGCSVYEGCYQITHRRSGQPRRYRGKITEGREDIATWIENPPAEIKKHPKGPCFMAQDLPWFRIHWHRRAKNVDDAILYVEKILDEAINRAC